MALLDTSAINKDFSFANNPIVAKANTLNFENGSIFRQVVFEVDTYYNKTAQNIRTFWFTVNADDNSNEVSCDISSAIRSAFANYKYLGENVTSTGSITYPVVTFQVSVYTRWMIDGQIYTSSPTEKNDTFISYLGGLSDYEIWQAGANINCSTIPAFTTKPEGEIFDRGQLTATTTYNDESGEIQTQFSTAQSGLLDSRDRTTILFVNSRGVFDTISVVCNESEKYEIASEILHSIGDISYRPQPYIISHKEGTGAVWEMSSGWVSREWCRWFVNDFLMSNHYWIPKDGKWLPVVIEPANESSVIYDKANPSMCSVTFIVHSSIREN